MPFESVVGEEAHCQALGLPVGATVEQIKAAYRTLALRYHPDKNPGSKWAAATENFMRVKAAYDYLLKVRSAGSGIGGPAAKTATSARNTSTSTSTSSNTTTTSSASTSSSSSSSFFTFTTAPPKGQPPIRHDLLLTLEEFLHGAVKKLLINLPPTSTQQQNKLLEVRVPAGATPGTVLYGRILSIGNIFLTEKAEDRSISVVIGDLPDQKFSRYPKIDSPNLKYVYELTEMDVRRAIATSYGASVLVLTIPTLGVDATMPGPPIRCRIPLVSLQLEELPPMCEMFSNEGLPLVPGSSRRGYLSVELKAPSGHSFASLIASAMSTTSSPAPKQPSTPLRDSTNKTQQQQQKTPLGAAKSKEAKQPKPPNQPLRRSERILKKNQPAPPPASPPPPPPPPSSSSSSSSPEVITIDSPTVHPVRHSSPDVSSMLSCAYCAQRFLFRRLLIEHERKHRCIYATCTYSSKVIADVVKHVVGCSKGQ